MGNRVFEVAKDLGVDHRELLKKCDALRINVRNYMSVLADADESRLRAAVSGGGGTPKEENVGTTGVVRRRRRPAPAKAEARSAPPARRPAASAPAATKPVQAQSAAPSKPPASAPAARKPAAQPASRKPAASAAEPRKRKSAEPQRRGGARVLSRPMPQATPKTRKSKPQRTPSIFERPIEGMTPGRTEPVEPEPTPVEPEVVVEAAEAVKPEPVKRKGDTRKAEKRAAAEARAEAKAAEAKAAGPKATEATTDEAKTDEAKAESGKPAAEKAVAKPAGGARILGSIPLEQLRGRMVRPQRSPGRGPRPGGPGANRGPGPRGPRPSGPGAGPALVRNFGPPAPASDKPGSRRPRSRPGPAGPSRPNQRNRGRGRRQVFNREDLYKGNRFGRGRKKRVSSRRGAKTQLTTPAAHKRVVRVNDTISVGELGKALGVKTSEVIRKLMAMGVMATVNQQVDMETAGLVATEYDYEVKNVSFQEDEFITGPVADVKEEDPNAVFRAPVVTIMGHVDHGKTTLLDHIRKASVASGEAGGITQHIGAYRVDTAAGPVVFLDTPGHAAFSAMRARGASVTDLIVLVVAVDDGVMPQTVESINHAKAAGVPLIVAVNKMDKHGADPERIKQELTKHELVPEEWGGETMYCPVSALKGDGVKELLEALALQAEILELKANPKKQAYGRVVEARVAKGRGPVCTVLVQEGTLKKGSYVVSGNCYGRIRALTDVHGKLVKEAGPSTPVEVLGLNGVPAAGETFNIVKNERDAKRIISSRDDKARVKSDAVRREIGDPLEMLAAMTKPDKAVQNVILKTDVSGSLEAIRTSLSELGTDEVDVRILHGAVGGISESDIQLASASDAIVIGFNVGADGKSKRVADQAGVEIVKYSVIYDVIDRVKELMSGLLTPDLVEEALGKAEVRAVFHIQKVGMIAGCMVTDGKILRNAQARIVRDGERIAEGKLVTLKRFKDDAREVAKGFECGISVEGYKTPQEGDVIEVFEVKEVVRRID